MRFLSILLVVLLTAGCGQRGQSGSMHELDTLYKPVFATGFAVLRAGERSSIISIKNPWQGAEGVEMNIFLERGGEHPPKGFRGVRVEAPLRKVVCMSSSYVAFIDALGETNAIVGVSGGQFIYNNNVEAADVGYDGAMNFELIASLQPDLVFIYGVSGENVQITAKLRELGIPYIYIGEYVEPLPLGRAEWLVAFGEFFNRRVEAENTFTGVCERYLKTRKMAEKVEKKPRVMFNAPYRDVWYLPSKRSYMSRLVEDAGGVWNAPVGDREAIAVGTEDAYVMMKGADVWLNPGQAETMADVLRENRRFAGVKPIADSMVFNNNARMSAGGGSDFWESGVVWPDIVLRDLVKILHPELLSSHELYYYRMMR